jgi:hypothetical protein
MPSARHDHRKGKHPEHGFRFANELAEARQSQLNEWIPTFAPVKAASRYGGQGA